MRWIRDGRVPAAAPSLGSGWRATSPPRRNGSGAAAAGTRQPLVAGPRSGWRTAAGSVRNWSRGRPPLGEMAAAAAVTRNLGAAHDGLADIGWISGSDYF